MFTEKQALFVFMYFCAVFFFFLTVDTKVVLTAAILFSRYSPLTTTEWELLTKHYNGAILAQQQPLQWGLAPPHVTHHKSKWNLIGPKQQLSVSLCSCLPLSLSPTLSINLLYLFLSHFSFSLSVCGSSLTISQWPFLSQQFKLRKKRIL